MAAVAVAVPVPSTKVRVWAPSTVPVNDTFEFEADVLIWTPAFRSTGVAAANETVPPAPVVVRFPFSVVFVAAV
jgi:hypothetical protein